MWQREKTWRYHSKTGSGGERCARLGSCEALATTIFGTIAALRKSPGQQEPRLPRATSSQRK
jgi:hypothetical protein